MSCCELGAEEHVVLLTMHHIVSDGWSMGVLVGEVAALYAAYVDGASRRSRNCRFSTRTSRLAARVAARRSAGGAAGLLARSSWRTLPAARLAARTDRVRRCRRYRGRDQSVALCSDTDRRSCSDLSRREGATLFMTLLAGFQLLLCRYAGQRTCVSGHADSERNGRRRKG